MGDMWYIYCVLYTHIQVGVSNLQRTELCKYGMKSVKLIKSKKNTVSKIFFLPFSIISIGSRK